MKNLIVLLTFSVFLANTLFGAISVNSLTNEAQRDSILDDPNTTILGFGKITYGSSGLNVFEISVTNFTVTETVDIQSDTSTDWNTEDQVHNFTLEVDESGNLNLGVIFPDSVGKTASVATSDWYNGILFSFGSFPSNLTLNLENSSIDSGLETTSFGLGSYDDLNVEWEGYNISFLDNNPGNSESSSVTGDLKLSAAPFTVVPPGDSFVGEFYIIQTVPEPKSYSFLVSLFVIFYIWQRRR